MKVCKKCKNHVANKAKICAKCGSDVSKAKIIKNVNSQKNKKHTQSKIKSKNINKQKKPIVDPEIKTKDQVVVTNKQNKKQQKKEIVKVKDENKNKNKKHYITKIKSALIKTFSITKNGSIKFAKVLKEALTYIANELYQSLKITIKNTFELVKLCGSSAVAVLGKTLYGTQKLLSYAKDKHIKRQEIKQNKPTMLKVEQPIVVQENKKEKKTSPSKIKKSLKFAFISLFVIAVLSGVYFVGQDIYKDLNGNSHKVIVTEKATTEKVFNMEDIITYNNVDYKVVKIESSKGNNYKSPKEGHQFLIVTVYIKNNSGNKVPYSYENWTMSNSKGEEKKRIFTSINVDTALYSGELVIGGIKTGSMVFEQPINDSKLKMNYYELKKDEDGNEVIDEAKRVFSISIKVPNKNKKQADKTELNDDVKVVKTNTKNKSY